VKTPRSSPSKVALWRKRSDEVLTSDVVASKHPGPIAPRAWGPALARLIELSRAPLPAPGWWTPTTAFFGSIETRTDPASYHWDGMKRLGRRDAPLAIFQFTLAGWGHFQHQGQPPRRVPPGKGFFAIVPSRHRYYLPSASRGWTFGWIGIYHPYLLARISKQVAAKGPLVDTPPDGAFTASALRLVRGAIKKDFRDRFEAELALFEFVLAYERWARQPRDRTGAGGRLLDTPSPLKHISDLCGFANTNHFCKVFRRFQHLSPAAYRQAIRS
jgi:AraC-like DNA-binding protein